MKTTKITGVLLVLALALGAPAFAQSGPGTNGSTGLWGITTGHTLPPGQWSTGWYVDNTDRFLSHLPAIGPFRDFEDMIVDRTRLSFSLGVGLAEGLEMFAAIPYDVVKEDNPGYRGLLDGVVVNQHIDEAGVAPALLGLKWAPWRSNDGDLSLGLWAGAHVPTRGEHLDNPIQTGEWDYQGGAAFTARFITLDLAYKYRGDHDTVQIADELTGGLGIEIPAGKDVDLIWEVSYIKFLNDCDANPRCHEPRPQTDTVAGFRWHVNDSVAVNTGLRVNLTEALSQQVDHHDPLGYVFGITYWPRRSGGTSVEAYGGTGGAKARRTSPPAPPVITVPESGATVATATPSVAGTAEPNAKVNLTVDGVPAGEAMAGPSGAWSGSMGPLVDGPHRVSATQTVTEPAPDGKSAPTILTSSSSPDTPFVVAIPVVAVPPPVPVKAPDTVTTDTVQFDSGSSRLSNIAKAVLDQVALRMKSEPTATAAISGYTDGREKKADALSLARAEACRKYLVTRHGLDASRISVEGKGATEPAAEGTDAAARKQNRRATIKVTIPG